ncbi:LysR family transcriptional regulator, nitrogen assimilation regulatory protein [Variovorax sp. CF079]|uniref:LysR substrate-binding domain-containing protein n=1 Tax=Variovorax sp. CF079 TaxID=1882774 RepID=UPI0008850CF6|nr:LysR substrate-binding domain-containing protein [Variovorax sp. CF079]SDD50493.1 LysR family transcriptional regulator, nitrogen assimilation regulatory protein [Variovorax sp. CF079]
MELRQLRYFIGASEAGSLLKASTRLHVAQPALGQQIAALESEVGAQLFNRSSRGVTLTDAGKVFLDHARVVLSDIERARDAVRELDSVPRGEVAIGLPTTVGLTATVAILGACRTRLPEVRLKVVEAYSGFLREWLQSGRLDLAVLFGDAAEPGLIKQPLLDEWLVFVASPAGPKLPKRLPLSALSRWPMILPGKEHGLRKIIDDACAPLSVQPNVVAEVESLRSVKLAVQGGIGATILPLGSVAEEVASGALRSARLESSAMTRRVVCATSTVRPATLAKSAVHSLVQEVIRDMVLSSAWPARWIGEPA